MGVFYNFMDNNKHFHIIHYLVLVVILGLAVVFFFLAAGNHQYQFKIAIFTSTLYFLWGVIHHRLEGDLHPKIMVEYLLIAFLAVILLKGAIFR